MIKKLFDMKEINRSQDDDIKIAELCDRDIAIIGVSGKFAGAYNLEQYWQNLRSGKDCITTIPEQREKDSIAFFESLHNKTMQEKGMEFIESGYLEEVDKFDYNFFSLSPKEAGLMDPNQRLFMETAWAALEDGGYGEAKLKSTRTGVFVGHSSDFGEEYKKYILAVDPSSADISLPGNIKSIIAGRISYLLDLKGPSIVVDTACSSALIAVHLACQSIRRGECEMALAGGVKANLLPVRESHLRGIGIESSDDRARAFDISSDGTGMGEGVGAVLLKSLDRALDDGDNIYAVIKGSAINQDGSSNGITAPNPAAQEDVILRAWKDADIDPETISYIEAHGTGTKLGDPIEIKGIEMAFRNYTPKKQFCAVGAVKTNIGHLDHAAGIAGLIKAVLALKHKEIPPNLHFKRPNERISFIDSPVYVNDRLTSWKAGEHPRRCGVSAFGLAGTNCHVVLEEAPVRQYTGEQSQRRYIFTLSAKSKDALEELIKDFNTFTEKNDELDIEGICYVTCTGRGHYSHRIAAIVETYDELRDILKKLPGVTRNSLNGKDLYYGEHRIVAEHKLSRADNDISEEERKQLAAEAGEVIRNMLIGGQADIYMQNLCSLYVSGAEIDWEEVYRDRSINKLSLPVYPFERNRCWVEAQKRKTKPEDKLSKVMGHPLLDRCLVKSMGTEIYAAYLDVNNHWVLKEHKVAGSYTVPGTAYLEIIREIAEGYYPGQGIELKDVIFISPLFVSEYEPKEMHIIIRVQDGHLEFTVASCTPDSEEWVKHVDGKIYEVPKKENHTINIDTLRFDRKQEREEYYKTQQGLVETGPRWKNVKEIYFGENEYLVYIELPGEYLEDLKEMRLHPAMMDYAVNPINSGFGEGSYLPLSYKSIKIFGSTPSSFYSCLKRKHKAKETYETITFDIKLADENGNVFIEIEDYTIKKFNGSELRLSEHENGGGMLYETGWVIGQPGDYKGLYTNSSVLVLKGAGTLSDRITEAVRNNGAGIIEVRGGECFKKISERSFIIGDREEDYSCLIKEIKDLGITQIIHLMTVNGDNGVHAIDGLEKKKKEGIYSLFYLTRALIENKIRDRIEIVLVSEYANEVDKSEEIINPHNAALFGLGKVVGQEYRQLKCRCIDIDIHTDADRIAKEIISGTGDYLAAYRQNNRYTEKLSPVSADNAGTLNTPIKDTGVYIITGGLGGIGLEISKYLTGRNKVNLAMISRSKVPLREAWDEILRKEEDKKAVKTIEALKALEEAGAEVTCYSADVSRAEELMPALEAARHKYGKINGIIHGAGVAGDGFIIKKEEQVFEDVIAPKMNGTFLLDKLTERDMLDFFIVFSSITSLLAGAGQGDYTAANAYLDSFAAYRNRKGKRTIAVNWAAWKETGMAVNYGAHLKKEVFEAISTREAIGVFDKVLESSLGRAIIGKLDYNILSSEMDNLTFGLSDDIKQLTAKKVNYSLRVQSHEESAKVQAVKVKGKDEDEFTGTEFKVAQVWSTVLGMNEIDIFETFNNMGGDSILATRVLSEMDKVFPGQLDITDIFTYTTIYDMADYLDSKNKKSSRSRVKESSSLSIGELLNQIAKGEVAVGEANEILDLMGGKVWTE